MIPSCPSDLLISIHVTWARIYLSDTFSNCHSAEIEKHSFHVGSQTGHCLTEWWGQILHLQQMQSITDCLWMKEQQYSVGHQDDWDCQQFSHGGWVKTDFINTYKYRTTTVTIRAIQTPSDAMAFALNLRIMPYSQVTQLHSHNL